MIKHATYLTNKFHWWYRSE